MEAARDLTHDLLARDWQEYADACTCHDRDEPVVCHAHDLVHGGACPRGDSLNKLEASARSSTDRALDYESKGCRFDSCRAYVKHKLNLFGCLVTDAVNLTVEEVAELDDLPLNEAGEPCPWPWEPQQLTGVPLGMYHCPYCGAMVLAGVTHPDYREDGPEHRVP